MLTRGTEKCPAGLARGAPPNPTLPVQVEGENVFLDQLLLHDVIKERGDLVHRDPRERHAQDAVELGSDERDAWLLQGLPENLVLDFQVTKLKGDGEGREKQVVKKTDSGDQGGNGIALNTGCSASLNALPCSCLLSPLHLKAAAETKYPGATLLAEGGREEDRQATLATKRHRLLWQSPTHPYKQQTPFAHLTQHFQPFFGSQDCTCHFAAAPLCTESPISLCHPHIPSPIAYFTLFSQSKKLLCCIFNPLPHPGQLLKSSLCPMSSGTAFIPSWEHKPLSPLQMTPAISTTKETSPGYCCISQKTQPAETSHGRAEDTARKVRLSLKHENSRVL